VTETDRDTDDAVRSRYRELEKYIPRRVTPSQSEGRPTTPKSSESAQETASDIDYENFVNSVKTSSLALRELARKNQQLARQNQEIQSEAERVIVAMRGELAAEKSRAADLETELGVLRSESAKLVNESATRIRELEALTVSLSEKLENTTQELKSAREWLDYLCSQAAGDLSDALAEADRLMTQRGQS
jgi:hypothetical protein